MPTPTPKPWIIGDLVLLISGTLVLLLVALAGLWLNDMFATEWPTIVIACLLVLLVGGPLYWWLAKVEAQAVIDPALVLVHWRYTPQEWQAYLAGENERDPVDWPGFHQMLRRVALFLGLVLWLALFLGFDAWGYAFLICLCVGAAGAAFGALKFLVRPQLEWYRCQSSPAEALITKVGAYVTQEATLWGLARQSLLSVTWIDGKPPLLEFTVKHQTRGGERISATYIPVPQGEEVAAQQVIAYFATPLSPSSVQRNRN